jgi:hypothetical protein
MSTESSTASEDRNSTAPIATEVIDSFVARQVAQRDQIAGNTRLAHAIEALHATTGWSPDRIATAIGRRRIDPQRAPAAILASRCLAAIATFQSKPPAAAAQPATQVLAPRQRTTTSDISMLSMHPRFIHRRLLLTGPAGPSDAPRAIGALSAVAALLLIVTLITTVLRPTNAETDAIEVPAESVLPASPDGDLRMPSPPVLAEPTPPAGPTAPIVVDAPVAVEVVAPSAEPALDLSVVEPPPAETAPAAQQPVINEPANGTDSPLAPQTGATPTAVASAAVAPAPAAAPTPAPAVASAPAPAPAVGGTSTTDSIYSNAQTTQDAIAANITASQQSTSSAIAAQQGASSSQVSAALGQPAIGIPTMSLTL